MPPKQSSSDSKSQQMNLDSLAGATNNTPAPHPSVATVSLDALQTTTPAIPAIPTPVSTVSTKASDSLQHAQKPDAPAIVSGPSLSANPTPSDQAPLDLSKIAGTTTPSTNTSSKPVLLGDSHIQKILKEPAKPFNRAPVLLSISQWGIILGVVLGICSYGYQRFLTSAAAHPIDPNKQVTIDMIKTYEQQFNTFFPINSYIEFQALSLTAPNGKVNLNTILGADTINYVHKKDLLNAGFSSLSQSLLSTAQQIDQLKQTIATNGGMNKTEYDLMKQDSAVSIQKSLMTVEVIKLSTALKVFYYLDSFINQFSAAVGLEPDIVKQQMERMIARGELDIQRYIQSCYMNPFEDENDCGVTQDFVNQYQYLESQQVVDPAFVRALLQFIDQKLENTTLPNLTLTFSNFDPKSDMLTLNIEVNTFQEDELGLISKGILNPHIFVVTNLINLLKQSTFIKDEGIDVKTLKINKKKLRVANKEFVVNNSTFTFTVPIQKATARDISDYIK